MTTVVVCTVFADNEPVLLAYATLKRPIPFGDMVQDTLDRLLTLNHPRLAGKLLTLSPYRTNDGGTITGKHPRVHPGSVAPNFPSNLRIQGLAA